MGYTIKKLASRARVSVRTLHDYDEMGRLKPAQRAAKDYWYQVEAAFINLRDIMFFRERGFSLIERNKIISHPDFKVRESLQSHRTVLQI